LGIRIEFRTWLTGEQRFSSFENIVDDNQTVSFAFPTHFSQTRETLQPISIDHVGTFFRLATHQLYKPILVIIHIAMTEIPIRLIAIKSSIEIRNQLINSIDIQFISQSDDLHEFYLEPNQIRSLPIQLCSTIKQIHIRTANFALDYCDDPVQWSDIEKNHQSFLRSCSIDGKEAVYYLCLQSKPKYPVILQDPSLSIYQLTIIPSLTICNLLPCTLTFEIPSYPQKFEINAYKYHREHTLNILQNFDILFLMNIFRMNKSLHLSTINDLHGMKVTYQRVIFYGHNQRIIS
ncbi:unnamed protein product, partial [Rotaria sp. Silwood2]